MTILVTLILVILMGALILASLYGIGWLLVELEDYKIKKNPRPDGPLVGDDFEHLVFSGKITAINKGKNLFKSSNEYIHGDLRDLMDWNGSRWIFYDGATAKKIKFKKSTRPEDGWVV